MAGSASNWFRPTAGPYAGQAVYILNAGVSRKAVLHGLNQGDDFALNLARTSQRPAGAARSKADAHVRSAYDLARTKQAIHALTHELREKHWRADKNILKTHLKIQRAEGQLKKIHTGMDSSGTTPSEVKGEIDALTESLKDLLVQVSPHGDAAQLTMLRQREQRLIRDVERLQPVSLASRKLREIETGPHDENAYILKTYGSVNLSAGQHQAMVDYVKNSYQVNCGLRTGNVTNSSPMPGDMSRYEEKFQRPRDVRSDIAALDSLVQTISKDTEIAVYRGIDGRYIGSDLRLGMELRDAGFMSMGFSERTASYYAKRGLESIDANTPVDHERIPTVLRINLREGARVIPTMSRAFGDPGQNVAHNEMLMDRDTTLTVTGVSEQDGVLMIDTEVTKQRST